MKKVSCPTPNSYSSEGTAFKVLNLKAFLFCSNFRLTIILDWQKYSEDTTGSYYISFTLFPLMLWFYIVATVYSPNPRNWHWCNTINKTVDCIRISCFSTNTLSLFQKAVYNITLPLVIMSFLQSVTVSQSSLFFMVLTFQSTGQIHVDRPSVYIFMFFHN